MATDGRYRAESFRVSGLDPDTGVLYAAGLSAVGFFDLDFLTAAFTPDGQLLWARQADGPATQDDRALDLSVAPDGAGVYVTGQAFGAGGFDALTVAYAPDGSERWRNLIDAPGFTSAVGEAMDVSPDGAAVYVAGEGGPSGLVTALDAADGTVT